MVWVYPSISLHRSNMLADNYFEKCMWGRRNKIKDSDLISYCMEKRFMLSTRTINMQGPSMKNWVANPGLSSSQSCLGLNVSGCLLWKRDGICAFLSVSPAMQRPTHFLFLLHAVLGETSWIQLGFKLERGQRCFHHSHVWINLIPRCLLLKI